MSQYFLVPKSSGSGLPYIQEMAQRSNTLQNQTLSLSNAYLPHAQTQAVGFPRETFNRNVVFFPSQVTIVFLEADIGVLLQWLTCLPALSNSCKTEQTNTAGTPHTCLCLTRYLPKRVSDRCLNTDHSTATMLW